jgi:tripartite-type tricarboxylate transporter receptor subunit TctC
VKSGNSVNRIAIAACALLLSGAAAAQPFPVKPVRIVNPAAPGGNSDIFFRILQPKMSEILGQPVVIDYRPGAGGIIGADLTAKSPPDGYTSALVAASFVINPSLIRKLPYDTVKDFMPLGLVVEVPSAVVIHPSLPAKNMKEFIALAKGRPGQINFSSSGPGTVGHLTGELLNSTARIKVVHIPYKGIAPATIDLVAGHVQLSFPSIPVVIGHVRAGRLRMIAHTGAKRVPAAPEVPAVQETVPGFVVTSGFSLVGPVGIPRPIAERINGALAKAVHDPANAKMLADGGAAPVGNSIDEHAAYIKTEIAKWQKAAKAAGIEPRDP